MTERISVYTLIDISQDTALQQQNFNALLQTVALRGNPIDVEVSLKGNQPMADYEFGEDYPGTQNVWTMTFTTDTNGVFDNKNGTLGGLVSDVHQVPVITDLYESVTIDPPVFDTINEKTKNIYFINHGL